MNDDRFELTDEDRARIKDKLGLEDEPEIAQYCPGYGTGDVGESERIAVSLTTGWIYRVTDWVEMGDGKITGRVVEKVGIYDPFREGFQ